MAAELVDAAHVVFDASLARDGEWFLVGVNITLSVVLSLAAASAGHVAAMAINR